jgi:hypothetical protein
MTVSKSAEASATCVMFSVSIPYTPESALSLEAPACSYSCYLILVSPLDVAFSSELLVFYKFSTSDVFNGSLNVVTRSKEIRAVWQLRQRVLMQFSDPILRA